MSARTRFIALLFYAGKCFDKLENRSRSATIFRIAAAMDILCVEAIDYPSQNGISIKDDIGTFLTEDLAVNSESDWIVCYRR